MSTNSVNFSVVNTLAQYKAPAPAPTNAPKAPAAIQDSFRNEAGQYPLQFSNSLPNASTNKITFSLKALAEAGKISPARDIEVFELHESNNRTYHGNSMRQILDAIYGKEWLKAEEIVFVCSDGYRSNIPKQSFVDFDAYLTFAGKKGEAFTLVNKRHAGETVSLGPYFLTWDNIPATDAKKSVLRTYGTDIMPWKVVGLDLIRVQDKYPKLMPPENERSANIMNGLKYFRATCNACHSLNGEGGKVQFDLNGIRGQQSSAEFRAKLLGWIDDPRKVRPTSTMPAYNPWDPKRAANMNDIVNYIDVMTKPKP